MKITENQMEEIEGLKPAYPYTLHRVDLSKSEIPWHWHEELEFIYILEGVLQIRTTSQVWEFREGEGLFINRNVLCTMKKESACVLESHLFAAVFLGGHYKSIFETKYLDPVLQDKATEIIAFRGENDRQKEILRKLRSLGKLQDSEDVEFQTRNLLSEIWLLLLEEIKYSDREHTVPNSVNQDRIFTMLSYIHENYKRKLTLEEIAASVSVSRRECLRCFQTGLGESPFHYLIHYRIQQAKKLLKSTDMPIISIAMETGFSTGAYFSKIFRRECGQTPGEYRRANRT